MSRRITLLVAALLALALMAPAIAHAADTTTYSFSGRNADAGTWVEFRNGGYEGLWIWGGTLNSKTVGSTAKPERVRGTFGFFYKEKYLPATATRRETYRLMTVQEAPATFTADNKLMSARLSFQTPAQIAVWYDEMPWEGEPVPGSPDEWVSPEPDRVFETMVTVNVDWTGLGPLSRSSFMSKTRTDGFFYIDRSNYQNRQATAVGSIVGTDGTVYFDGSFDYGALYNSKSSGHMKGMWFEG
ncbi:MAG: hypothetical protein KKA32_08705 [Actinobacteria bacterium]|nr:hypothetical protein [Actinomycetota bacterium]